MNETINMTDHQEPWKYSQTEDLAELYSLIKSNNDQEIEKQANLVRTNIVRHTRLSQLKIAFDKASNHFITTSNKPVNDACVDDIEAFFLLAAKSKYKNVQELSKAFRNVSPEVLKSMAHFAKAQDEINIKRRRLGRELRANRK